MIEIFFIYLFVAIILEHAHLVCPIWVGWADSGFRAYMISRPVQFFLVPAIAIVIPIIIGLNSHSINDPAFKILILVAAWWNAWHFGAQNFGLASLFGWRGGSRLAKRLAIIGPTMAGMISVMYIPISIPMILINEILSMAHWIGDIGLTTYVFRKHWAFVLILVILIGFIGFYWRTIVYSSGCSPRPVCIGFYGVPLALSLRYSLGFWHIIMSRWVWQLSNPVVRQTIGARL